MGCNLSDTCNPVFSCGGRICWYYSGNFRAPFLLAIPALNPKKIIDFCIKYSWFGVLYEAPF